MRGDSMTLIEAAKQARDALETFGHHYGDCPQYPTYTEPENYPPCNCGFEKALTALDQAIAKAEQEEPVAWLTGCPECGMDGGCNCGNSTWQGLTDKELDDLWLTHHDYLGQPKTSGQNGWAFERAIEAKLKEKNT